MGLHDLLKLYKHGYSKVTDHVSREIRFGRLSREQGIELVNKHEHEQVKYLDQFCEWLDVTPRALQFMLDSHRNPLFWKQVDVQKWEFQGWSKVRDIRPSASSNLDDISELFSATNVLEDDREKKYITIGKGWP